MHSNDDRHFNDAGYVEIGHFAPLFTGLAVLRITLIAATIDYRM
jgi:hypothetical protein